MSDVIASSKIAVMPKPERLEWMLVAILDQPFGHGSTVDIVSRAFVESYIAATRALHETMSIGPPKCPTLGRDLSALFRKGYVTRYPRGMDTGMHAAGFSAWVFAYKLTMTGKVKAERIKERKGLLL